MVKDADQLHVFGGDDDTVWLAPLGSTLPTTLAAPDAAFEDVGYLGEDGMTFAREIDIAELRVHQGGAIKKKKVTSSKKDFGFVMVEDNAVVRGVVDTIISSAVALGVTTDVISDVSAVWVGAAVVDLYDGTYMERYVFSRLEVTTSGEESWNNSDFRAREAVGTVIGSYSRLSGDAPA
jgi:hypothetical protein